ncbi:MAG: DUF494 domain-containing protein [Gammaproteobacteria bacterium]
MKQTELDVLIFLFENYMDDENDISIDLESLRPELQQSGFDEVQIGKAFSWLEGLTAQQANIAIGEQVESTAIRIFTLKEQQKLDLESRGFLMFLEQIDVIGHHSRELILDRVMALESNMIDMEQLKWIVLMVLFKQPGSETAFGWMEDLIMDEHNGILH